VAVAQVLTYIYQLRGKALPGAKSRAPATGANKAPPKKPTLDIAADLLEPRKKGKVSDTGVQSQRGTQVSGAGARHLGDA
jgi:hypothetical protein